MINGCIINSLYILEKDFLLNTLREDIRNNIEASTGSQVKSK